MPKENLSEITKKIQSAYARLQTASASFVQTVQRKFSKYEQQLSGTVKIKLGNKYRIEHGLQTIVTDGKLVWIYTPSTDQVLIDSFKNNTTSFSPDKLFRDFLKEFVHFQENIPCLQVLRLLLKTKKVLKKPFLK